MCLKTLEICEYGLDPAHFLSALGLAWEACLKKTKVELELSTYIDMLSMVEKAIRGGICQGMYRYAKANNNNMKNYNKNNESSYIEYLDVNNLNEWAMSQKLPASGFKWIKNLSRFNEIFKKNYREISNRGYILEVDVDYPKKLFDLHRDLPFLLESKKVNKVEKLICSIEEKKNMLCI